MPCFLWAFLNEQAEKGTLSLPKVDHPGTNKWIQQMARNGFRQSIDFSCHQRREGNAEKLPGKKRRRPKEACCTTLSGHVYPPPPNVERS